MIRRSIAIISVLLSFSAFSAEKVKSFAYVAGYAFASSESLSRVEATKHSNIDFVPLAKNGMLPPVITMLDGKPIGPECFQPSLPCSPWKISEPAKPLYIEAEVARELPYKAPPIHYIAVTKQDGSIGSARPLLWKDILRADLLMPVPSNPYQFANDDDFRKGINDSTVHMREDLSRVQAIYYGMLMFRYLESLGLTP